MKVSQRNKRRSRFERREQARADQKFMEKKSLTAWDKAGIHAREVGECCPCKFFDASTVAAVWCYCDCHLKWYVRLEVALLRAAGWAVMHFERTKMRIQRRFANAEETN